MINLLKESSAKDALHPLLHNRHLQTILPSIIAKFWNKEKHWNLHFKRTHVHLSDGGTLSLDVAVDGAPKPNTPMYEVEFK